MGPSRQKQARSRRLSSPCGSPVRHTKTARHLKPGQAMKQLEIEPGTAPLWRCGGRSRPAPSRFIWPSQPGRISPAHAAWWKTALASGRAIYGVNTGFGKLAQTRIPDDEIETAAAQSRAVACGGRGRAIDGRRRAPGHSRLKSRAWRAAIPACAAIVVETAARSSQQECAAGNSRAGIGRRIGRSGAACAYVRRADRRRPCAIRTANA